jgi:hypothetical protein
MTIERPMFPPRAESRSTISLDDLLAAAKANSGTIDPDALSYSNLSEFLRFALDHLLEDFDYEADKSAGAAVAARTLALLINGADYLAGEGVAVRTLYHG